MQDLKLLIRRRFGRLRIWHLYLLQWRNLICTPVFNIESSDVYVYTFNGGFNVEMIQFNGRDKWNIFIVIELKGQ